MDIKLNATFENLDGSVMKEQLLGADGKPNGQFKTITMRDVLRVAVTAELQEDTQGSGQEVIERKMKNYDIFLKVRDAADSNSVDLSVEDIVHIKPRIGKVYHTLIAGPTLKILEGKDAYGKPLVKTAPRSISQLDNPPETSKA